MVYNRFNNHARNIAQVLAGARGYLFLVFMRGLVKKIQRLDDVRVLAYNLVNYFNSFGRITLARHRKKNLFFQHKMVAHLGLKKPAQAADVVKKRAFGFKHAVHLAKHVYGFRNSAVLCHQLFNYVHFVFLIPSPLVG